jgi:hypothetical protein
MASELGLGLGPLDLASDGEARAGDEALWLLLLELTHLVLEQLRARDQDLLVRVRVRVKVRVTLGSR